MPRLSNRLRQHVKPIASEKRLPRLVADTQRYPGGSERAPAIHPSVMRRKGG